MTKTYELSNERMIMADVDEEHHTATVSVYVLDDLVKEANKVDVLEQIRAEIQAYADKLELCKASPSLEYILQIIDKDRSVGI